jgi:hypothetical protein
MQKVNGSQKPNAPSLKQFKAIVEAQAKEIYLKRQENNVPGDALSDWLLAEKMVKEKYHL